MACGSVELGQIASGSGTQVFWLGNRKVRSQVVSEDRSGLSGREQLGKLGEEEDEKEEPMIERRRECTNLGSGLGDRD